MKQAPTEEVLLRYARRSSYERYLDGTDYTYSEKPMELEAIKDLEQVAGVEGTIQVIIEDKDGTIHNNSSLDVNTEQHARLFFNKSQLHEFVQEVFNHLRVRMAVQLPTNLMFKDIYEMSEVTLTLTDKVKLPVNQPQAYKLTVKYTTRAIHYTDANGVRKVKKY